MNIGIDPVSGYTQFQSQNIEDTTIEGIEAGWRLRFGDTKQFMFDGSAFYARGDNEGTGNPSTRSDRRRPLSASAGSRLTRPANCA